MLRWAVTRVNWMLIAITNLTELYICISISFISYPLPPQNGQGGWVTVANSATLSLSLSWRNRVGDKGLVKAHWSCAGMCTTSSCFCSTFSLTKNRSISICLVLACRTGLWASATTLWLSQKILGEVKAMPSSVRRICIHSISAVVCAKLRYSTSVIDLATKCCLRDHQEITLGPRRMAAPDVDCLSSGSEAQSASQKTRRLSGWLRTAGDSLSPWWIVPLMYLRMRFTAIQWDSRSARDDHQHTIGDKPLPHTCYP